MATKKTIINDEEIDRRAIEETSKLGLPPEMGQAVTYLVLEGSYEEAARRAETTPEIVRQWTQNPNFVMAVGWFVIGLADNYE